MPSQMPPAPVSTEKILAEGQMLIKGLVPWASNYTFLVTVTLGEAEALAIYKPSAGERPLWDFDSGTLYLREVAAYRVSIFLGWPAVPPVVAREGPHGAGSVQAYVPNDPLEHYFAIRERSEAAAALRRIALFDHVVNNADRKGGHVLRGEDGTIWAIDHGLTFHTEYKLRTVIWDWAGSPIPRPWLDDLANLREALADGSSALRASLEGLILSSEVTALRRRIDMALRDRHLPRPLPTGRNVPYPLV